MLSHFSRVQLLVTPWTVAPQTSLSLGFSRQGYRSGLPCLPPGDLPNPGIEPTSLLSPALAGRFFTASATWEAHSCSTAYQCHQVKTQRLSWSHFCVRGRHYLRWKQPVFCVCVCERERQRRIENGSWLGKGVAGIHMESLKDNSCFQTAFGLCSVKMALS